ncbi:L-rhamnose mutarotase [Opitutus sp. GAS368]|nr:L-rhamnose mutarotase [Opitutus sp. GAS368]
MRKAFIMAVNLGRAEEYIHRHNPIWPELAQTLKAHGVRNYSIFYHPASRQLFGYVEIQSELRWAAIAQTEICQRWWRHMSELMPTNDDGSPATAALQEVFHLK